jgi:hypothetical protein
MLLLSLCKMGVFIDGLARSGERGIPLTCALNSMVCANAWFASERGQGLAVYTTASLRQWY